MLNPGSNDAKIRNLRHRRESLKRGGLLLIAVGLMLFFGTIYLLFVKSFGFGIPCSFNYLTGLDCPGCGMTGAVFALLRLDFARAFRLNALSLTVMPALMVYGFYRAVVWISEGAGRGRAYSSSGFSVWEKIFLIVMGVMILGYSVIRNIL